MIQRCHNPGALTYGDYGARGVRVFEGWRGETGFASFLAYIGERPSLEYTLDRVDNSKGYEPGNVRWATHKQQQRNRRDNQALTLGDVTKTIYEWAETTGLSHGVIKGRMRLGWSAEEVLQTPRLSKIESGKRSALARNKKSDCP